MDPDKWDTPVWYRVTRNPQEFHGLTSCQRDPRIWGVTNCIFMGYAPNSAAYRFLVHESNISDIHKNMIMESRIASLFKDVFLCKSKVEPN